MKDLCTKLLTHVEGRLREENDKEKDEKKKIKIGDKSWQVGRSKVFLKEELQKIFEMQCNKQQQKYCTTISRFFRGYLARRVYKEKKES